MTKMSDAVKKADEYRDAMNAGKNNLEKHMPNDFSCVVYFYQNNTGKHCAIGYKGRAKKPAFNYSYSTNQIRIERVVEWIDAVQNSNKRIRTTVLRDLTVGDVLCASWGWEQTNVDFYKVISLVGKTMVEIVKIGAISVEDKNYMAGTCKPDIDNVIGEPMRKRANGEQIRIDSVRTAYKTEIEKRVAEWKLRIFCDKNKDIQKVNQLFTDCLNLGFTTLENKTEMFIYFLNYCDRKKEFLTLKKYLDIIKSEFAVVGQEDSDYHKSLLNSLNSLTCSR
ncbi:MAG: hypothetical protein L3J52_01760 [Proteobacteria bacterium]|nr:hypothetical protein [Pseudomonadota bacterium]